MTFLDTVDGKLARVTVTVDGVRALLRPHHRLGSPADLVHRLGVGVAGGLSGISAADAARWRRSSSLTSAGRFIETFFKNAVGGCSLFAWRPFDSYFRLVMARRNPNLLAADGVLSGGPSGRRAHGGRALDGALDGRPRGPSPPGRTGSRPLGTALHPWIEELGNEAEVDARPGRNRSSQTLPPCAISCSKQRLSSRGPQALKLVADPAGTDSSCRHASRVRSRVGTRSGRHHLATRRADGTPGVAC